MPKVNLFVKKSNTKLNDSFVLLDLIFTFSPLLSVFLFGSEPNWYCETVKLKTPDSEFVFPVLRWVEPGYHYKIPLNDTSLPQNDPFPDQRGKELEIAKEKYKFKVNGPNLPVTVWKFFK